MKARTFWKAVTMDREEFLDRFLEALPPPSRRWPSGLASGAQVGGPELVKPSLGSLGGWCLRPPGPEARGTALRAKIWEVREGWAIVRGGARWSLRVAP